MSDIAAKPSGEQPLAKGDSRNRLASKLSLLLWGAVGLFLIGYGMIAFESGTVISPRLNTTEDQVAKIDYLMEQARNDVSTIGSPESEAIPLWMRVIEQLNSSQYINSDDSVMTTERHYVSMSEGQRSRLGLHMMLGLVLMTFGFFQFLPAFRRNYRKAHRAMGAVYMVAGFTSMTMSASHLLSNNIADIYNEYVFFVGLWLVLVIAVVGLSAAAYSIFKKNIAAHLGWQALAFGSFLTAPIQRAYWVGMAPFAGDASFNEMNMVANVSLFAQSFLAAYLLFYINRTSSPVRANMKNHSGIVEASKWIQRIGYALVVLVLATMFSTYIVTPGFAASTSAAYMVPASAAQWHDAVVSHSLLRYGLFAAMAMQLFLGMRLFLTNEQNVRSQTLARMAVTTAGVISGGIMLTWGYQLGMPRHEVSLAGAFYAFVGGMQILFNLLFAWQAQRLELGKMREALCLVLVSAMAPAIMVFMLWLNGATNLVPDIYREAGHGYQMAAAFALFLPVFIGHLYAMFSAETRRYAVN